MSKASPDLAIRCRDLHKIYKTRNGSVHAVKGLNLEVFPGECFGLLGPNGAGKTTTIEILEGLLEASAGEVEILGLRWGQDDDRLRQRMGISLQETRFGEKLSVVETLILFRSFYRTGNDPLVVLKEVGLTEKAHAWVGSSPACSASAWRWPAPWLAIPRCCFWMSPRQAWIRNRAASYGIRFADSASEARRRSSRHTTWMKQKDCAVASPWSIMGK